MAVVASPVPADGISKTMLESIPMKSETHCKSACLPRRHVALNGIRAFQWQSQYSCSTIFVSRIPVYYPGDRFLTNVMR